MLNLCLLRYFFPKEVMSIFVEITKTFETQRNHAKKVLGALALDTRMSRILTHKKKEEMERLGTLFGLQHALAIQPTNVLIRKDLCLQGDYGNCNLESVLILGTPLNIFDYPQHSIWDLTPRDEDYAPLKKISICKR